MRPFSIKELPLILIEDLSTPSDWQRFHLSFNRTLSRERADGVRSGLTMYGENDERFDRISMTDL